MAVGVAQHLLIGTSGAGGVVRSPGMRGGLSALAAPPPRCGWGGLLAQHEQHGAAARRPVTVRAERRLQPLLHPEARPRHELLPRTRILSAVTTNALRDLDDMNMPLLPDTFPITSEPDEPRRRKVFACQSLGDALARKSWDARRYVR